MCAPRMIRRTSKFYSSSCYTRVNMGASIYFTAAMIRAFSSARSRGKCGRIPGPWHAPKQKMITMLNVRRPRGPKLQLLVISRRTPTSWDNCVQGRSRFVCWNITRVILWLLCNVHFLQSTQRTSLQRRPFVRGINNCSSEEYRCTHFDACVARTWISYRCVPCHPWCTHRTSLVLKKSFSVFLWLWTIPVT
jgi:hypothetical protein